MAAPNLIGATLIFGKTTGTSLANTATLLVLNNAASSNKCFKINTLNVANANATTAANITVNYYTTANLAGSPLSIVANVTIPAGSTLSIIDKSSQYYMEENSSIGAIASASNILIVTASYEDIS
jgi:hypothetical protein